MRVSEGDLSGNKLSYRIDNRILINYAFTMNIKRGKAIDITEQLSPLAATTLAQWIGGATVIANQKTLHAKRHYAEWLSTNKDPSLKPVADQQVAYLVTEFPFLSRLPAQIRRNAGAKWFESVNAAKVGLRQGPVVKPKHKKRNCYVTQELFTVQALDHERCLIQIKVDATRANRGNYLVGVVMPFPKTSACKAFYISRKGRRFWLSMTYEQTVNVLTASALKAYLITLTDEQLQHSVVGYDLGVARQVTGSDGSLYHLDTHAQAKITRIEQRRVRYQRRYVRRRRANDKTLNTTGKKRPRTQGEKRLLTKLASYGAKIAGIKRNHAHHASKAIADTAPLVAVFEDLKLTNMVRRPKAKQDPDTGRWLRNGAKAKSGLNKALLGASLGQLRDLALYKLSERGKLAIKVNPHHSSQECRLCGYTDKNNRLTQADFCCLQCGHQENADSNAAGVIKQRGIQCIRSETFSVEKTKRKKIALRKAGKTQAHELASLEDGGYVSLSTKAATDDVFNSALSADHRALDEACSSSAPCGY